MNAAAYSVQWTASSKKRRRLFMATALAMVIFSLMFMGSDPEAENAASQGPTARERWEIMSRKPVSRTEYETLRLYGWDKDRENRRVIILDDNGEPQLVEYRPAGSGHGTP